MTPERLAELRQLADQPWHLPANRNWARDLRDALEHLDEVIKERDEWKRKYEEAVLERGN